jgi:hypothetical protein
MPGATPRPDGRVSPPRAQLHTRASPHPSATPPYAPPATAMAQQLPHASTHRTATHRQRHCFKGLETRRSAPLGGARVLACSRQPQPRGTAHRRPHAGTSHAADTHWGQHSRGCWLDVQRVPRLHTPTPKTTTAPLDIICLSVCASDAHPPQLRTRGISSSATTRPSQHVHTRRLTGLGDTRKREVAS